jgi:predicted alpha/beta superfamily hydrolase
VHEAIIVGIENTPDRLSELTPVPHPDDGGGQGDRYLDFVQNELKPEIDRQLRTFPDTDHTGMIGSSLGGLISACAGATRSDVFGRIGAMSPSTWWDNFYIIDEGSRPRDVRRRSTSTAETAAPPRTKSPTAQLADSYRQIGVSLDCCTGRRCRTAPGGQHGGQHSEVYWRQRVPGALSTLLGPL